MPRPIYVLRVSSLMTLISMAVLFAAARPAYPQIGTQSAGAPQLVILDTDIGDDIDDVFALSLALTSPELRVVGITSAWGDTALRSRMIDRVLCETGRGDIPVLTGVPTNKPDAAAFSQAPWARAGLMHQHGDAVAFILDQARLHPGEITLIAIAPLTNIGAAIDRDPVAFRKLKRVVLMGGSVVRGYGDVSAKPSAEYNIAMDPVAAQKLFRSGVPIFMMPLDSTQIPFVAERRAELASISTPLTDSIQVLINEWDRTTHQHDPTLFDPVAVAYAIDPGTCATTPEHIEVDERGYTRAVPGAPNAQVCLATHPEAFFSMLTPRLLNQKLVGKEVCSGRP